MNDFLTTSSYTTLYVNKKQYEILRDSWARHADIEQGTIGGRPWFKVSPTQSVEGLLVMEDEDA